ncbi:MAG: hypothetical protein C5B49_16535 [Bdellovibrio sp.]|nr:MAG: hypothetical protein C5B49_16535 [Bdellovibrio sp.]
MEDGLRDHRTTRPRTTRWDSPLLRCQLSALRHIGAERRARRICSWIQMPTDFGTVATDFETLTMPKILPESHGQILSMRQK